MDYLLLPASAGAGGINLMRSSRNVVGFTQNRNYVVLRNATSSLLPSFSLKRRTLLTVAAKKDSGKKKADSHSFIPTQDEATGPFPEAVLLKEKKVEENGRLVPEFADAEERQLFEELMLDLESDMDVEQMRHYEVVYLIHEDRKDEVEIVNNKVQEFIKEKKGKIWRFSDWGMRRLAYRIQKAYNAHYILMNFEIEARWINEFKSMLDKEERVIRHLVMKKDQAETEDCPPPPEFHTLRAGMDDYDEEDDIDYDEEEDDGDYDEEDDDGDYDEEEDDADYDEEEDDGDHDEEEDDADYDEEEEDGDDDEEEDDGDDDEEEDDADDDEEDWDDTSEASNGKEAIFYVDEDTDDKETELSQPTSTRSQGRRKQKTEKVLH